MEHDGAVSDGLADPEAQVGRALRQLRLARNWSQEEVAVRMTAYGYEFHQTTIAKIEGSQRPLRVRELADFAALYGVEIQDLGIPQLARYRRSNRRSSKLPPNCTQPGMFETRPLRP